MATLTIPGSALALLDPIARKVNAYWRPQLDPVVRKIGERFRPRVVEEQEPAPVAMRGTPEIYFAKAIDNSRLVRVIDPRRAREMMQFAIACVVLFVAVKNYAWRQFSAIEYGYRIES